MSSHAQCRHAHHSAEVTTNNSSCCVDGQILNQGITTFCRLEAMMAEERAAFEASCTAYEAKKEELMQKVQQQQSFVRRVLESARVQSPECESR